MMTLMITWWFIWKPHLIGLQIMQVKFWSLRKDCGNQWERTSLQVTKIWSLTCLCMTMESSLHYGLWLLHHQRQPLFWILYNVIQSLELHLHSSCPKVLETTQVMKNVTWAFSTGVRCQWQVPLFVLWKLKNLLLKFGFQEIIKSVGGGELWQQETSLMKEHCKIKEFTIMNGKLLIFVTKKYMHSCGLTDKNYMKIKKICKQKYKYVSFTLYIDSLRLYRPLKLQFCLARILVWMFRKKYVTHLFIFIKNDYSIV